MADENVEPGSRRLQRVAVVGGGITGLSTAFYLERYLSAHGAAAKITLFEASGSVGGKVQTEVRDGFVIERGPDSFLARKTAALDLIEEVGLSDSLVGTGPLANKTFIVRNKTLHRSPPGLQLGVPTRLSPFVTTGLLSLGGKLRASLDFVLPKSPPASDRSLGAFLERRLGKEVLDYLVEPILAGIYAGDLRRLSLKATFPQFETFEQQHGSLIRGMRAQAQAASQSKPAAQGSSASSGEPSSTSRRPKGAFLTLRTGLYSLIDAVVRSLQQTTIRLNAPIRSLERQEGGRIKLLPADGEAEVFDAVVLATEIHALASVLPENVRTRTGLSVPYVSVGTVALAFSDTDVPHPLDGSGFVVPKKEGLTITASTYLSSKWPHTTPAGFRLLRCFVGRSGDEGVIDDDDERLLHKVRRDLETLTGIRGEPRFHIITRWRQAMPQYTVGHLERIEAFRSELEHALPGVFAAGAGFTGVGIPDCILQGKTVAKQVADQISSVQ